MFNLFKSNPKSLVKTVTDKSTGEERGESKPITLIMTAMSFFVVYKNGQTYVSLKKQLGSFEGDQYGFKPKDLGPVVFHPSIPLDSFQEGINGRKRVQPLCPVDVDTLKILASNRLEYFQYKSQVNERPILINIRPDTSAEINRVAYDLIEYAKTHSK